VGVAVDFDGKALCGEEKIQDVRPARHLPPDFRSGDGAVAQRLPQLSFRRGGGSA
jgi:hypothetical protein